MTRSVIFRCFCTAPSRCTRIRRARPSFQTPVGARSFYPETPIVRNYGPGNPYRSYGWGTTGGWHPLAPLPALAPLTLMKRC